MKPDHCTLQHKACFSEPHLILDPQLFPQGWYHLSNPPPRSIRRERLNPRALDLEKALDL